MRRRFCSHEEEIAAAATTGQHSEEHLEHLMACGACRDAATVSGWLTEVATRTARSTPVPAAETLWWRAQVVRNLCDQDDRIEKRTRPLMLAQIAAVFLALVTMVGFLLTTESVVNGVVGVLGELLGGTSVAMLAVAATFSLLTGALVAWQAARELG